MAHTSHSNYDAEAASHNAVATLENQNMRNDIRSFMPGDKRPSSSGITNGTPSQAHKEARTESSGGTSQAGGDALNTIMAASGISQLTGAPLYATNMENANLGGYRPLGAQPLGASFAHPGQRYPAPQHPPAYPPHGGMIRPHLSNGLPPPPPMHNRGSAPTGIPPAGQNLGGTTNVPPVGHHTAAAPANDFAVRIQQIEGGSTSLGTFSADFPISLGSNGPAAGSDGDLILITKCKVYGGEQGGTGMILAYDWLAGYTPTKIGKRQHIKAEGEKLSLEYTPNDKYLKFKMHKTE